MGREGGVVRFSSLGIYGCSEIPSLVHTDTKLLIMILLHLYGHVCMCVCWHTHTFLMENHVWVLIHRIRSLIELDQHVLALRGFLHMHFVWDCNRHCYYNYCYAGKRIIIADYRQLFKRFFKQKKKNIIHHPQCEHTLLPEGKKR